MQPFQVCLEPGPHPAAAAGPYPLLAFTPHLPNVRRSYKAWITK